MKLKVGKLYKRVTPRAYLGKERHEVVKVVDMKIDKLTGGELYAFEPIIIEPGYEFYYRGYMHEMTIGDNFEEL